MSTFPASNQRWKLGGRRKSSKAVEWIQQGNDFSTAKNQRNIESDERLQCWEFKHWRTWKVKKSNEKNLTLAHLKWTATDKKVRGYRIIFCFFKLLSLWTGKIWVNQWLEAIRHNHRLITTKKGSNLNLKLPIKVRNKEIFWEIPNFMSSLFHR